MSCRAKRKSLKSSAAIPRACSSSPASVDWASKRTTAVTSIWPSISTPITPAPAPPFPIRSKALRLSASAAALSFASRLTGSRVRDGADGLLFPTPTTQSRFVPVEVDERSGEQSQANRCRSFSNEFGSRGFNQRCAGFGLSNPKRATKSYG